MVGKPLISDRDKTEKQRANQGTDDAPSVGAGWTQGSIQDSNLPAISPQRQSAPSRPHSRIAPQPLVALDIIAQKEIKLQLKSQ